MLRGRGSKRGEGEEREEKMELAKEKSRGKPNARNDKGYENPSCGRKKVDETFFRASRN